MCTNCRQDQGVAQSAGARAAVGSRVRLQVVVTGMGGVRWASTGTCHGLRHQLLRAAMTRERRSELTLGFAVT